MERDRYYRVSYKSPSVEALWWSFDVDGALNSLHVYYIFCRETIEMGKCVFLMDKTDKMGSYGDNFYFSRRLCATVLCYHVGDNINIYNKDLDKFSFRRMK